VCHIELARVGYNDIAQHYPAELSDEERARRCHALLESVLYTFLHMDGAHRNTQAPHLVDFEGVIATSSGVVPAPAFSGLHSEYRMQIERVAQGLNSLHNNAIIVHPFDSLGEFTEKMSAIIADARPYRLPEFAKRDR
jgi:CRISPR-associated protein Cst2